MNPKVSIIIRSKNEERWILKLLLAIKEQDFKDYEIILVDNNSNDKTLDLAENHINKLVKIDKFKPGAALNRGCEAASGDYFVFISAHCLPCSNKWLSDLYNEITKHETDGCVGVYGRQKPFSFSTAATKRDLTIVFGLDKKIQKKDPFFHNANSIISRSSWEKRNFDEDVTNIEDRIWADAYLNEGKIIIYTPNAEVYHYHGIHQDGISSRASSTEIILDKYYGSDKSEEESILKSFSNCAILFFNGSDKLGEDLLKNLMSVLEETKLISKTVLVLSRKTNIEIDEYKSRGYKLFIRNEIQADLSYLDILPDIVNEVESNEYFDNYLIADESYPFRSIKFILNMYREFSEGDCDILTTAFEEKRNSFSKDVLENSKEQIFIPKPRKLSENSLLISRFGACTFIKSTVARNGNYHESKLGVLTTSDSLSSLQITSAERNDNRFRNLMEIINTNEQKN